jgi:hypothetical protein
MRAQKSWVLWTCVTLAGCGVTESANLYQTSVAEVSHIASAVVPAMPAALVSSPTAGSQDSVIKPVDALNNPGNGEIVVQHTNKCLDIDAAVGNDNGARAQQWDCHGGPNQQFDLVPAGGGSYFIIVQHTKKCLDIDAAGGNANGARAQQWDCHFGANQRFRLTPP